MTPQSPSKQAPWELTQFSQSPSAAPSYFPDSLTVWNLFIFFFCAFTFISIYFMLNLLPGHKLLFLQFPFKGDCSLGKVRSRRASYLGCRGAESPGWFDVSPKNSAGEVMHVWACCDEAASHQLPIAATFWIIWIVSTEGCSNLTQNLMQIYCFIIHTWAFQSTLLGCQVASMTLKPMAGLFQDRPCILTDFRAPLAKTRKNLSHLE